MDVPRLDAGAETQPRDRCPTLRASSWACPSTRARLRGRTSCLRLQERGGSSRDSSPARTFGTGSCLQRFEKRRSLREHTEESAFSVRRAIKTCLPEMKASVPQVVRWSASGVGRRVVFRLLPESVHTLSSRSRTGIRAFATASCSVYYIKHVSALHRPTWRTSTPARAVRMRLTWTFFIWLSPGSLCGSRLSDGNGIGSGSGGSESGQ